jgi:hypothetical protein
MIEQLATSGCKAGRPVEIQSKDHTNDILID